MDDVPICAPAFVPFALTEINCSAFPFESTIIPIVEKYVAAVHVAAADPLDTTWRLGGVAGATIPVFHVAEANPVSAALAILPCVKLKVNCVGVTDAINPVTFKAPLPLVVLEITTVCPTAKLLTAVIVATLLVSAVLVIVERLFPGTPEPKSSHFCCSLASEMYRD